MSGDWMAERATSDAETVALDRLARYAMEREERMAEYRKTWERQWAKERAAAATGVPSLWRVK